MRLPYPARPGQGELIDTLRDAQSRGRHAVIEAATGTGKTVAALVAGLSTTAEDGRRLLYLTRTNSQQSQVVREHRALVASRQDPGLLIPFMGRRQYCPLLREDERFRDGTPEELGRLCRDAKRKAQRANETGKPVKGACPYYQRLLEDGTGPVEALLEQGGLDAAELGTRVTACGSCPYEALKALLPKARTVVLPYIFFLEPRLRETLHTWLGDGPDGQHVVIDEAHNLLEAARSHHSPHLTANTLKRALKEAEDHKDPVLAGRILSTGLLHALESVLWALVADHVMDEDGRVPPGALEEGLMARLRVPTPLLARAAADLDAWGEIVREERRKQGKLPRSYLGTVGAFLRFWLAETEAPYVHLVLGGENPAIEALLLEPSHVLGWLHECASTVHLSGTLTPLSEHVERCALPGDTVQEVFESPFEADRLRLYGIDGLHRRWKEHQEDPRHAARQHDAARRLLHGRTGKTGLFFPSHAMANDYLEEGLLHGLNGRVYREIPQMDTPAVVSMVERFKADPDPKALLVGVLGGRITEGLDFPGDTLSMLILFGVPYPRPSARLQALIDHGDRRHDGKGWTYAVHNPVGRVLRQAVGRLVRGPDDRGTAVLLDERAARFRTHLKRLWMVPDVDRVGEPIPREGGFASADALLVPS